MLVLAQADAGLPQARRAYGDCLNRAVRSQLDSKTSPAAFDKGLATACAAKEAAYRNALMASEKAAGASAAAAEELASMDIEDLETNTKDLDRLHMEQGTRPERRPLTDDRRQQSDPKTKYAPPTRWHPP